VFWRSVLRVQVRAEEVLRNVFSLGTGETEDVPAERQRQLIELVSAKYPFEVVTEDVILPLHATAANRSIRDLGLRSQTGATIAAIYRADSATVNPDPETILLPGDVVLLLGSRAQIGRAVRYLTVLSARPEEPLT
jgi:K+/H+ antiporter YhaU regulatory subunit KhtT